MNEPTSHGPEPAPSPLEHLLADLARRWRGGDQATVEQYQRRYPQLLADDNALLDLIGQEFLVRRGAGAPVALEEYLQRFPHLAGSLRIQLPLLAELNQDETLDAPTFVSSMPASALTKPTVVAWKVQAPKDFQILDVLGRGGMGVAYKAWQESLRRVVALKMLRQEMVSPEVLARFRVEAEAVGRLQHPHIVQIFAVGEQDGCPYLALEFVANGSLDRHLNGAPVPASVAARLLETLARAVHYAHQRGVVHRDLKPGNVLLGVPECQTPQGASPNYPTDDGASGKLETNDLQSAVPKIADFGLARLTLGASDHHTHAGSVLGTPSYMAPEQAAGKSHEVGPAADIYALGAILYELLTGRPPFRAATPVETLFQVQFDEPVPPTRLQSATPRDLEVICLKCLRKEPQGRYATALELAEDLDRFVHDRPILARPASGVERLWRWCRRRPEVAVLLGTLLVVILGGLVLTTILWLQAKNHAEDALQQAQLKEEQRILAVKNADLAGQREQQARQARQRTWQALDEMSSRVINDWLAQQYQVSPEQKAFLQKILTHYEEFAQETGNTPAARSLVAAAHLRIGAIRNLLGLKKDALSAYQQAAALLQALVTEFPSRTEDRQNLAASHNNRAALLESLGQPEQAVAAQEQALTLQAQLAAEFPKVPAYRVQEARSHNNLGQLWKTLEKRDQALGENQRALDLLHQVLTDHPGLPEARQDLARAHLNRGVLLQSTFQKKDALAELVKAIPLLTALIQEQPGNKPYKVDLALARQNRAVVLGQLQRHKEALAEYPLAIAALVGLAREHPAVPKFRKDLATCRNNRAMLLRDADQRSEALQENQQALNLYAALVQEHEGDLQLIEDLARSHNNHGLLLMELEQKPAAADAFRQALALQAELLTKSPRTPAYRLALARSYTNRASLLSELDQSKEALEDFQKAGDLLTKLTAESTNPEYRLILALNCNNRSLCLGNLGRNKEALAACQQGIALLTKMAEEFPPLPLLMPSYNRDLATCRYNQSVLLDRLGQPKEALVEYWKAVDSGGKPSARGPYPAFPAPPDDHFSHATVQCLAEGFALRAQAVADPKAKELAGTRSLELLKDLRRRGWFNDPARLEFLRRHASLEVLRGRPDFQALLADLEKQKKNDGSN